MAAPSAAAAAIGAIKRPSFWTQLGESYRRTMFNTSHYHKYGLLRDDCLIEYPEVEEALRRLPQEIKDVRTYRLLRAVQCSIQKVYMPKEQWTKYEEDVKYLQPYIDEVKREMAERAEWDNK